MEIIDKIIKGLLARSANFTETRRQRYIKCHIAALAGSNRKALDAFCMDCVSGGGADIRECQGYGCSLYYNRPECDKKELSKEVKSNLEIKLKSLASGQAGANEV